MRRHRQRVFRLVISILGPSHAGEAEELTQDVFVRVYRRLGQFRGDSKFSSWLYRIAYNVAVDHRSRAGFQAAREPEEMLEMTPTQDRDADPFAAAVDARRASVLRECVGRLPHLYRSVLHLHYWIGMTVPEISRALETREGTVKSYLHRARARLHRMLAKRGLTDV